MIDAWQEICAMKRSHFGGQRTYNADFGAYDKRASDLHHTALDIYIGIKGPENESSLTKKGGK